MRDAREGKRLDCGGRPVALDRPRIMGVLNVTPDSFFDGGRFFDFSSAVAHAREMVAAGADIIDIGGESTRPGAAPLTTNVEIERVVPVVRALAAELSVPVSVDTSKPDVMRAAAAAGAGMINDVYALRAPGAAEAASEIGLPVCLMHMQGEPRTMQKNPRYDDVVAEVFAFLAERLETCMGACIRRDNIVVDPGFGFGKTLRHNYELLAGLGRFAELGVPLLVGMSRKSMIRDVVGPPDERLVGSVAAAVLAAERGASIVRVHDVAETAAALAVLDAVRSPAKL